MKKKYVLVGSGSRSRMFLNALLKTHEASAELCALCDLNLSRTGYHNAEIKKKYDKGPYPVYPAHEFDRMIAEKKPDTVIVTTIDRTHHKYIVRAMELGCDVISEKPMTVDEEKCLHIFKTMEKTRKKLTVTFNYRYSPRNTKVKEILASGAIGDVVSVHFEWMLDTKHGADYFRRWHRDKKNSGGLLVHKATHHFDLVNWWLGAVPVEVFAMGRLAFYGRENAENRGIHDFYTRCSGSKLAEKDNFALNMKDGAELEGLYLKAEHEDGYIRDQSVFGDGISIEDTMSVMVRYNTKAVLTYSLNAFCPWEGYRISFNGTKGRLEMNIVERSYVSGSAFDQNNPDFNMQAEKEEQEKKTEIITLQKLWNKPQNITWEEGTGGHGGGDVVMLDDVFSGAKNDPFNRAAGIMDGAKSILIGIAGNRSIAAGKSIMVKDLFDLEDWQKRIAL